MMECKKMLTESGGDIDKAIDRFRAKGVKAGILQRAATEGRVVGVQAEDGKSAALVEVNCNTDFTAKSEPVLQLATNAARLLLHNPDVDIAQAANVNANAVEVSQQTGENVRIGRSAVLSNPHGKVGMYLYGITNKIGVLLSVSANASEQLIRDLA